MNSFAAAWAETAHTNNQLKILTGFLILLSLTLGAVALKQATRAPILIERGCATTSLRSASLNPTPEEVESFVRTALSQRFDTDSRTGTDLLSLSELQIRSGEQEELKKRGIKQRVLLNAISKVGDELTADVDRLLSVDAIRSAFPFPLKLRIETTERTTSNPYGLVLSEVNTDSRNQTQEEKKQ